MCTSKHEGNARGLLLTKGKVVDTAQTSMCGAELGFEAGRVSGSFRPQAWPLFVPLSIHANVRGKFIRRSQLLTFDMFFLTIRTI